MLLAACGPAYLRDGGAMDATTPQMTALPPESQVLMRYYAQIETGFLTQGLLRRDGGGPDVPFTARNLVDNFIRIALFEEYTTIGNRIVARQTPSQLHKWDQPVRMKVEFGDTVPQAQRVQDRQSITKYGNRLARITGLSIRQVSEDANYYVFVVNEAERRALAPRMREIMPGISDAAIRAVVDMPRSTFCLVFALDQEDTGTYSQAVAIIRAEHPDLMRLSCFHEELAQGLGLSNDSPSARPSIFNDDEEFGLLTSQDELLLRMLYDPRMRPGIGAAEARGLAEIIAAELIASGA
ncbi:MAG: DUF2927 domain-containing protein [Paracoccaceae bacterium]